MANPNEVATAYERNIFTLKQVGQAIAQLPCYGYFALRPGAYNGSYYKHGKDPCLKARKSKGLKKITGDHLPIPNMERKLPEVCLLCPVFAPALTQLASYLGQV